MPPLSVRIKDDGQGFPSDILSRVGEPYVTTRGSDADALEPEPGSGLGLGLFIAKTLLERSGATLSATNAQNGGAMLTVMWPRQLFEVVGTQARLGALGGTSAEPLVPASDKRHITGIPVPSQEAQGHATGSEPPRGGAGPSREDIADRR